MSNRTHTSLNLAIVLWLAWGSGATAAEPGGSGSAVARGEQIARSQCSACHVVATHQEFAPVLRTPTPSFSEIANRPGTTRDTLQKFLAVTHWDMKTLPMQMPSPMLTTEQSLDVTRYILSLRAAQSP